MNARRLVKPQPIEAHFRTALIRQTLLTLELDEDGFKADDVLNVHVGQTAISLQLVTRDSRGKVVTGVTTRLRFPVTRA